MHRKFILISLIVIVGFGVFFFMDTQSGTVPSDRDGLLQDQQEQIMKNNQNVLNRTDTLNSEGRESIKEVHSVSIQVLQQKDYDGRDFTVGSVFESPSPFTKYYVTYK